MSDIAIIKKCIQAIKDRIPHYPSGAYEDGYEGGLQEAIEIIKQTVADELEP